MKEQIVNQIVPILIAAIVAVMGATVKKVGRAFVTYIEKKKEVTNQTLIADGHENKLRTAKEVWNIIEEKFRITENVEGLLNSKADEFDKLLLGKIPGITQENLDYLRQTVAGEFNKGKQAILAPADIQNKLQSDNSNLQNENQQLKEKLSQVQNLIQIQ